MNTTIDNIIFKLFLICCHDYANKKREITVWQTIKINYYWRDLLMSKGRQLHCIMMIETKYYLQIIMCCTCCLFVPLIYC
jgi:hypothetical protein